MSAVALILVGIANSMRNMADEILDKLGKTPSGKPSDVTVNVQIKPEPSEVVMEIEVFSLADQTYKPILEYTVEKGYELYLNELSIAPDSTCKTKGLFKLIVGSRTLVDKQLLTSLSMGWGWLKLGEGAQVIVLIKSTDGSTNGGNVTMNGRRVQK